MLQDGEPLLGVWRRGRGLWGPGPTPCQGLLLGSPGICTSTVEGPRPEKEDKRQVQPKDREGQLRPRSAWPWGGCRWQGRAGAPGSPWSSCPLSGLCNPRSIFFLLPVGARGSAPRHRDPRPPPLDVGPPLGEGSHGEGLACLAHAPTPTHTQHREGQRHTQPPTLSHREACVLS